MKRFLYLPIAVAALVFSGCTSDNEQIIPSTPKTDVLTATFEGGSTRTSLDGRSVKWSEGDNIAVVFNNGSTARYSLQEGAGTNEASFGCSNLTDAQVSGSKIFALYPYNEGISPSGNWLFNAAVPDTYDYVENDCSHTLMMGLVEDGNVSFKNAGAMVNVRIGAEYDVDKVVFEADKAIAGTANVSWNAGSPVYFIAGGGSNTITVNIAESYAGKAKFVLIPLPSKTDGSPTISCTAKLYKGEELVDSKSFANAALDRNKIYTMTFAKDCFYYGFYNSYEQKEPLVNILSRGGEIPSNKKTVRLPESDGNYFEYVVSVDNFDPIYDDWGWEIGWFDNYIAIPTNRTLISYKQVGIEMLRAVTTSYYVRDELGREYRIYGVPDSPSSTGDNFSVTIRIQ